jgi:gas vesicle protein
MNLKDVQKLDRDEILALLGLEKKPSTGDWLAGALGTFGVGLLVGAGIALILAPKPGHELRREIRDRLRRVPNGVKEEATGGAKAATDPQV